MTTSHLDKDFGGYIRRTREAAELSLRQVSDETGLSKATLSELETGDYLSVKPHMLEALAKALHINLADIYIAAGYQVPTKLPTFQPYLRSKYRHLPPEARAELQESFARIAERYGIDENGPAPGQDE